MNLLHAMPLAALAAFTGCEHSGPPSESVPRFTEVVPSGVDVVMTSGVLPSTQIIEVNGGGLASPPPLTSMICVLGRTPLVITTSTPLGTTSVNLGTDSDGGPECSHPVNAARAASGIACSRFMARLHGETGWPVHHGVPWPAARRTRLRVGGRCG